MGRVAAQPVGQTGSIANGLPEGRAKRVNPPLTAIFEKELVRKYGLFFRMLHLPDAAHAPCPAYISTSLRSLISVAPSGMSVIVG